jgi:hypothetical protein
LLQPAASAAAAGLTWCACALCEPLAAQVLAAPKVNRQQPGLAKEQVYVVAEQRVAGAVSQHKVCWLEVPMQDAQLMALLNHLQHNNSQGQQQQDSSSRNRNEEACGK